MRALKASMRFITWLNDRVGKWASFLILPIFLLLLMEVILRYAFGSPTVWSNELSQLLFGAYAILAGGHLMAHSDHVNVDLVHAQLPPRVRALLDVLTSVLFFLFTGAVLYFGSSMAFESVASLEHSQSAWNPPVYPFKLAIPVAALLLLLQGLVKLLHDIFVLFGIDASDDGADAAHEATEAL